MTQPCPCGRAGTFGSVLPLDRCCGRYLDDPTVPAPDAESLMRSRYTAYALGRTDYLLQTWDDGYRPRRLRLDPGLTWQGLQVLAHRVTGADRAEVEFVARFTAAGGGPGRLHEVSRFRRVAGRWRYLDGDTDPRTGS